MKEAFRRDAILGVRVPVLSPADAILGVRVPVLSPADAINGVPAVASIQFFGMGLNSYRICLIL